MLSPVLFGFLDPPSTGGGGGGGGGGPSPCVCPRLPASAPLFSADGCPGSQRVSAEEHPAAFRLPVDFNREVCWPSLVPRSTGSLSERCAAIFCACVVSFCGLIRIFQDTGHLKNI
uniref:Uncharacterized protein n=1 Tax=Oryzias sinensis TaxID=183150 RepID=A0A8C7WW15_9TELE